MSSRREQLSERVVESGFVRNIVGPKILAPVADWYERNLSESDGAADSNLDLGADAGPGPEPLVRDAATPPEPAWRDSASEIERAPAAATSQGSSSVASAKSAEAFLAGNSQDDPAPMKGTDAPSIPVDATQDKTSALVGQAAKAISDVTGMATGAVGAMARPAVGGIQGMKEIALRVKAGMKDHNLNVVAAGIAFWGLMAIPAIFAATVSIYGLVADPDNVESHIEDGLSGASPEVKEILAEQLTAVAGGSGGGLAVGAIVGVVLALWTSSGAMAKLMATFNLIWGLEEDRGFVKLRGTALVITFGGIVFILAAAFTLGALPAVLSNVGLGDAARWMLNIGRFPAMLVVMAIGLSVLYWAGPNRSSNLKVISWGAAWATVLWLVVSGLFSVYTARFATYNETYGTIGAIVVLLLWLFLTAFMVLIGAEVDAAREQRSRKLLTTDTPTP